MNRGIEFIDEGLLLRRMVAGDEAAFTLLYRRKHPAIYRFALHMSGNCAAAEDVTQEVFMTLIRDAKRFDPATRDARRVPFRHRAESSSPALGTGTQFGAAARNRRTSWTRSWHDE